MFSICSCRSIVSSVSAPINNNNNNNNNNNEHSYQVLFTPLQSILNKLREVRDRVVGNSRYKSLK